MDWALLCFGLFTAELSVQHCLTELQYMWYNVTYSYFIVTTAVQHSKLGDGKDIGPVRSGD